MYTYTTASTDCTEPLQSTVSSLGMWAPLSAPACLSAPLSDRPALRRSPAVRRWVARCWSLASGRSAGRVEAVRAAELEGWPRPQLFVYPPWSGPYRRRPPAARRPSASALCALVRFSPPPAPREAVQRRRAARRPPVLPPPPAAGCAVTGASAIAAAALPTLPSGCFPATVRLSYRELYFKLPPGPVGK